MTVLLIPSVMLLEVGQNFRFKPNSSLEPGGSLLFLHKLWKARLFGWNGVEGVIFIALLKFCRKFRHGSATKPNFVRHWFFVCLMTIEFWLFNFSLRVFVLL
jgi:hypothetical protein